MNIELDALAIRLITGIEHGDDEHKAWLAEAVRAICDGKTAPPPRGKGKAEAELAAIRQTVVKTGITEDEGSTLGMVVSICNYAVLVGSTSRQ